MSQKQNLFKSVIANIITIVVVLFVGFVIGFKVNSAEYKVMGLAPYGNPDVFYNHFKKIITIKKDGSYQLNQKYFAYQYGLQMTTKKLEELFGVPIRVNESELTQVHKDIAAALQKITEEVVLAIAVHAKKITGSNSICLAGGVALNCVANGKLQEANIFDNVYIQPASGDAGSAVGAALYVHHHVLQNKKGDTDAMPDVYLGTEFTAVEIEQALQKYNFTFTQLSDTELFTAVADYINGTNAIGWFQGRMEYGPRALGNRSIIADPRNKENWQKINKKIKFRESFRPFAPAVLAEYAHTYFSIKTSSPYMLLVGKVLVDTLPAITHVDGSARIQTVHKETNKTFHSLLEAFYKKTGCPVLINTSFNVRGEPIVHSPSDAISSFINTEMDYLVLGNFVVARSENEQVVEKYRDTEEYLKIFELD
jgi:carbamoyltransferase